MVLFLVLLPFGRVIDDALHAAIHDQRNHAPVEEWKYYNPQEYEMLVKEKEELKKTR